MTLSVDLHFLLSLLIRGAHTDEAPAVLRRLPPPCPISRLHVLLVENALHRHLARSPDAEHAAIVTHALRAWRGYVAELVFPVADLDYDAALRLAVQWQNALPLDPPAWSVFLFPALAASSGATHYLSLDPAGRKLAKNAGLKLLPAHY